ncbi:hypothetical protein AB0C34_06340 [Nocardia sp. NPDC049220]|uniref:effector-associated constant component EACC1 n=1 Tax=Nocardia sp. NPDC049220 TaxID=3155273 RepID=UPI003402B366
MSTARYPHVPSEGAGANQIGGPPADVVQLLDWFRRDDALRGQVQLRTPCLDMGRMGRLADVVMVTLGAGLGDPVITHCELPRRPTATRGTAGTEFAKRAVFSRGAVSHSPGRTSCGQCGQFDGVTR